MQASPTNELFAISLYHSFKYKNLRKFYHNQKRFYSESQKAKILINKRRKMQRSSIVDGNSNVGGSSGSNSNVAGEKSECNFAQRF